MRFKKTLRARRRELFLAHNNYRQVYNQTLAYKLTRPYIV